MKKILHTSYLILHTKYVKLFTGIFLALLIAGALFMFFIQESEAAWFDDAWRYRKAITVTNNTSAENNVYVTLSSYNTSDTTRYQTDCGDIRFTAENGQLMKYYVVSGCGTASTTIHIKFETLAAGAQTIYIYYGNSGAGNGFEASDFSTAATNVSVSSPASEETTPGPIAYWAFDEGTGNTVYDAMGIHNGTILGNGSTAPVWQSEDMCVSDKCLQFDGTADYVSIGSTAPSIKSVSFWVKPNTTTEYFFDINGTANIQSSGGTISATGFTAPIIYVDGQRSSTITANAWHYITVTTTTALSGIAMNIGKISTNLLQGFMDEVKIYPYVRSAAEINQDFASRGSVHGVSAQFGDDDVGRKLTSGLVGYWKMDETSGDAADSSGNVTTLTNNSTTPYTGAKFGNGAELDGSTDYFEAADNATLSVTGDLTLSAWINNDDTTGSQNIVGKWDGTNNSYLLALEGDELRMYIGSASNHQTTSSANLSSNTFTHVAGVYNASTQTVKLYVNGVEQTSTTTGGTIPSSIGDDAGEFVIGADDSPANYFDGHIDEARVYNRALDPSEVKALYEFAPGPIGWWKMDENMGSPGLSADMLVYRGGADTNLPQYRRHAANWGTEGQAVDIDGVDAQVWTKVVANPLPTSDEKVMCSKDAGDDVNCQIWNGTSWGNLREVSTNAGGAKGFDVAYEQQSGQAMACFFDGVVDTSIPDCDIWNGAGWITGSTAPDITSVGMFLNLFPDPNSDYIAMMTGDQADDDNVAIWNGSSWGNLQEVETTSTTSNNDQSNWGAWDSNGDFMALWFDDAGKEIEALQFDKTTLWGAQIDGVVTGLSATTTFATVRAEAHPTNGQMIVVVTDDDTVDTVEASFWNGSTWGGQTQLEDVLSAAVAANNSLVHVAYEQFGDTDGIVTYGGTQTTLKYRVFDTATTSWGIEQSLPSSTDAGADWHQLASDPNSDNIMLTLVGSVDAVDTLEWNGSAWESAFTNQEPTSDDVNWNAWFTYDSRPDAPADTSGNGNDGRMEVTMTEADWVPGKYGSALDFDGSNDAVTIAAASDAGVDFNGSEAFTAGAWVYIATMPGSGNQDAIITKWDETSALRGYRLIVENDDADSTGNFQIDIYDESADQTISASGSNDTVSADTWYYVTFTFNGGIAGAAGDLNLYTNGILTASNSLNASFLGLEDVAADFSIGDYDATDAVANSTAFTGRIDDVRIYNYARTQKQIISDMNAGHPSVGSPIGSPVGHWSMDEGYGGTAYNTGNGSSIDGTLGTGTSAPTWTNDGKFGKALSFDGSNDFVAITDNNIFSINTTNKLTASGWFYLDALAARQSVISKGSGSNYEWDFRIETDGKIGAWVYTAAGGTYLSAVSAASTITAGQWYQTTMVVDFDKPELILYLNGVALVTDTTTSGSYTNGTAALRFGERADGTNDVDGKVDEVRIYNYALTVDEVKVEYNQGKSIVLGSLSTASDGTTADWSSSREYCVPGDLNTCNAPVGEWRMDENTGSDANDTSENSNTGSLSGPIWAPGIQGGALQFDGSDDYVNLGIRDDILRLSVGEDITISGWAKLDADTGATVKRIISNYPGTSSPPEFISLGFTTAHLASFSIRDTSSNLVTVTDTTALNDGKWHYLTGVRNSTDDKTYLYVDGVLEDTATDTTAADTGSDEATLTYIGANEISGVGTTPQNLMDGFIDDVRIYNYARTPAQIAWEYSKGAPVAYYAFDECEGATAYNSAPTFNDSAPGKNGTITAGDTSGSNDSVGTCSSGTSTEMWNNGTTGKRNASLDFDGTNDYVDIGAISYYSGLSEGSITGWFRLNVTGTVDKSIFNFSNGTGTQNVFLIDVDSTMMRVLVRPNAGELLDANSTYTFQTGSWYHFAYVTNGTGNSVYINGVKMTPAYGQGSSSTQAFYSNITTPTYHLLGSSFWSGALQRSFPGQIDDVKIFNYALTPTQVKTDYNDGAVRFE